MKWHKVVFSPAQIGSGYAITLQEKFSAVFLAAAGPANAGMFQDRKDFGCTLYFSPGASEIAMPLIRMQGGGECEAPKVTDVHPLVINSNGSTIPFGR